uniref:Uncharacterized protein n=1 Tax=Chromera velia CCMP2878 TaxID=1169474 RepID=A0A0G4GH45_9ALVE|mmetsp:Transcript_31934/g.63269  ORF Transcript_31934/g.63269 Transcript_31934/m.63269 type:complete len:215 (-) Transcript_31934:221-865(-)|eukprot:Cvel_21877.t1-p1 / transcript=Cvel_21877.t1 / gene=Cvel_21877 / organism=Chromera_velia_CCMP2878 / gene_product=hypothetical protein / transcript_product=hypothetical protein / location=Cvel_scaffold2091:20604-22221(+) / protein_length=214 / sequence_SO=supercontig / SO=protein_coding / is_pseudo=false
MSIPHPNCPFPLLPSEDFPLWSWMLKDKKYYLLYSNRHRSEFYDTLICDSMKNWPKGVVDAVRWYKFFFSAQYKLPASKDFFYDSFAPTTYYAALEQYYDVDLSGLPAVLYSRDRQEVYRLKIEKIDREETSYVPRYVSRYVQDLITRPPSWFRLRDLPESPVPPREAAPPSPPQTPLARTAAAGGRLTSIPSQQRALDALRTTKTFRYGTHKL